MQQIIVSRKDRFDRVSSETLIELINQKSDLIVVTDYEHDSRFQWRHVKNGFYECVNYYFGGLLKDGKKYDLNTDGDRYRTDPFLVEKVKQFGNGVVHFQEKDDVDLVILQIPDDVEWYVEYDINDEYEVYGREIVVENHRCWSSENESARVR